MRAPTAVDRMELPRVGGIRHRSLMLRGTRVHLAEAGSDAAPVVVLLHGFPQHWYAWREIMLPLAADHHVVAMDLPGFGWSDASIHGYSTSERSRYVLALLDELGVEEVDLVGHDWGAWLGFRVALDAPGRVRRLVSISEIHPWPSQLRLVPRLWRMWVTLLFETPGLSGYLQRSRKLIHWFLSRDASDAECWNNQLVDIYAARAAEPASSRAGQRMHAAFVARDIARLLLRSDHDRTFETPTLLIGGDNDAYIRPELMKPPRARSGALAVKVVKGGHFILDENPVEVAALIRLHLWGELPGRHGPGSMDRP